MTGFVLVHSPLVGPATWSALGPLLRTRGIAVVTPDIVASSANTRPLWREHAASVAAAVVGLPALERAVLVGHSAAGPLLPAIRAASGRGFAGYIFMDAGLPDGVLPRKGNGAFADLLARLYQDGHRFPEWTDEDLREVIPDAGRRAALLAELRPAPASFWDEVVPVFDGWPDAPCGYLRFVPNPSYEIPANEARSRGWAYHEMPGSHFQMLVDPAGVADALLALARDLHLVGAHR
jgi:hypothetical protein